MLEKRSRSEAFNSKPVTSIEVGELGPRIINALQKHNLISFALSVELGGNLITLRDTLAQQEEVAQLKEQLSRRRLFTNAAKGAAKKGLIIGIPLLVAGSLTKAIYDANFSPEAQVKYEEEQARNSQKKKDDKAKFEKETPALGLEPTTFSYDGWRASYPQVDSGRKLTEVSRKVTNTDIAGAIEFPGGTLGMGIDTSIAIHAYKKSDDTSVDLLKVTLNRAGEHTVAVFENRFLLDKPTPGIDTSVILVENTKGERKYVGIRRVGTPWRYEIRVLEEVKR